jgi:membrane protein implicated in regulation of membrane protease activity
VKRCKSLGILLAAALASGANSSLAMAGDETAAIKELIPTGSLRVGIVFAPALSAFFAVLRQRVFNFMQTVLVTGAYFSSCFCTRTPRRWGKSYV